MKKYLLIAFCVMVFPLLIMLLAMAGVSGGGAGSVASPLQAFATEEEAYDYQYIGSELGVPWDIVLLADGIEAYQSGRKTMKDYNPILTSLEFCILKEEKYELVTYEDNETETDGETTEQTETPENEKESETAEETGGTTEEWELCETNYYEGQEEILKYLELEADELTYKDAGSLIVELNKKAEDKSDSEEKYEVILLDNPDYESVLRDKIGLSEEYVHYVMEIYESHYLVSLYGYSIQFSDIELPKIVQGNVTRADLAAVACSLINHPYFLGGKSAEVGAPQGPLDCSGYVDWVYIQCFGVPVSNGKLPEGVAVSGTALQYYACESVTKNELKVGDLGFMNDPASLRSGQINHVGIFLGTYDKKEYWIHCAGKSYGTPDSPSGRVGISLASESNSYNPMDGTDFSPAMKSCNFRYYRRPQFEFVE